MDYRLLHHVYSVYDRDRFLSVVRLNDLYFHCGKWYYTKLSRSIVRVISNIDFNKKAFQSNGNRLLSDRCTDYVVNKFEHVGGPDRM